MLKEEWKDIPGYEGFYQASTLGRIKSYARSVWGGRGFYRKEGRILRSGTNPKSGYQVVVLYNKTEKKTSNVHQLVLETFVGPRPEIPGQTVECRHLDGNPSNNTLTNLVWGTHVENLADQNRHGTRPKGENHWTYRRRELIKRYISIGYTSAQIASLLTTNHNMKTTEQAIAGIKLR